MASASTWGWLKQGDVGISLVSWGDRRGLAALAGERDKAELVLEPGLSKEKRGETGINASCPAPGCSSSMARSRDTPPPHHWQCFSQGWVPRGHRVSQEPASLQLVPSSG